MPEKTYRQAIIDAAVRREALADQLKAADAEYWDAVKAASEARRVAAPARPDRRRERQHDHAQARPRRPPGRARPARPSNVGAARFTTGTAPSHRTKGRTLMSIRRLTYVSCDGCGSNPTEPMTGGAKEARHYAQEVEGYVRRNGMDLCADCVSDAKSDKEA